MQLEIGKSYVDGNGNVHTITGLMSENSLYRIFWEPTDIVFVAKPDCTGWNESGDFHSDGFPSRLNLVREATWFDKLRAAIGL